MPKKKGPKIHELKVILVGKTGAGKTNLINVLIGAKFQQSSLSTTVSNFVEKKMTIENKKYNLEIWDTAGQERFRSIAKSSYKGADGILLMYDVSKKDTFKHIKTWIKDIQTNIGNAMDKIAIIVIGNKSDLPEKEVDKKDVEEFENNMKLKIIEASAKENKNVNESMIALVDRMIELGLGKIKKEDDEEENNRKLSIKQTGKKNNCCGGGDKKNK